MTKAREIKQELQEAGWTFQEGARHTLAISPDGKMKIPIPRHGGKDIPIGTLQRIRKQTGLR